MVKLATGQTLRSAERMLDVLSVFSTTEPALTARQIAGRLNLAQSTLSRILEVLTRRNFISYDETRGVYTPHFEIIRLAEAVVSNNDLISATRIPMDRLLEKSGESNQLAVLSGDQCVFVNRRVSNQVVKVFSPLGQSLPCWDGRAAGQALIAWCSASKIDEILPEDSAWRRIGSAISGRAEFLELLAQVRQLGYAINNEFSAPDVWAVAAPVRDHTREVVAAITVPVLASRITSQERILELAEMVCDAAQAASANLFYSGDYQTGQTCGSGSNRPA
uniref:Transcriptional regulator, IclR family n=2 Tax=Phyllobacteriaceae TaxID=69277 RepID=Q11E36_CHESB